MQSPVTTVNWRGFGAFRKGRREEQTKGSELGKKEVMKTNRNWFCYQKQEVKQRVKIPEGVILKG